MNRTVLLRLEQKLDQQVARKGQELRNIIIETLSQPGSGRVYGKHQASAPGEPPAVDDNRLRGSIGSRKIGNAEYAVGTNVEYAPYLEYGAHVGARSNIVTRREYGARDLKPRPFMRPSIEAFKAKK